MALSTLAPWFGSNRMLAEHVGSALEGCSWVGVVFAGGMSELPHIKARTIVVNDLHRHVINLARVVADDLLRPVLIRRLARKAFHPDQLKECQEICSRLEPMPTWAGSPDLPFAEAYFVCCWMGRSSKAGIDDEFNGRPSIRWKSDGGDSMVRYMSAMRTIVPFSQTLRRCTFETMDCFEFLERCEDLNGHGIYADPPFPKVGRRYKHNAGQTDAEEASWHKRLRDALQRFERTRVVARFYEHPMIRDLYSVADGWTWKPLVGRKQSNESAPEVLIVRNEGTPSLFDALTS